MKKVHYSVLHPGQDFLASSDRGLIRPERCRPSLLPPPPPPPYFAPLQESKLITSHLLKADTVSAASYLGDQSFLGRRHEYDIFPLLVSQLAPDTKKGRYAIP